ncbi:TPA: hypothetical protein ACGUM0_003940 [Vibrio vulnificus]
MGKPNITVENAHAMQAKSAEARKRNNEEKAMLRKAMLDSIKTKTLKEISDELNIGVNLSNDVKQEVYTHLLKAMIDVEVIEKAKHRFKTEQMLNKYELDGTAKESGTRSVGLTLKEAIAKGVINKESIGVDDVELLELYV